MMQIDIENFRALAAKAMQGEWSTGASSNGSKILYRPQCQQEMVGLVDADYIAAVYPTAILALLERLETADNPESERVDTLMHIRGASSCCDVWDHIDEVVPYDPDLYSLLLINLNAKIWKLSD